MLSYLGKVRGVALIAALIIVGRVAVEVSAVYLMSPLVTSLCQGARASGVRSSSFLAWILGNSRMAIDLRGVFLMLLVSQGMLVALMYLRSIWEAKLSMRVLFHIRDDVYDHVQRVGFSFHDRMSSGQLINRTLGDLQAVRNFVNTAFFSVLDVVLSVGAYLVLLGMRSSWLLAGALLPVPICVFLVKRFCRRSQPIYHAQQQSMEDVTRFLTENINGVHTIRTCGMARREMRKYQKLELKLFDKLLGTVRLQSVLGPSLKGATTATHVVLFVAAAFLVGRGKMNVGDIVIVGSAMGIILSKLQQLNQVIEAYQKGIVSAQRLFEVLDAPREHASDAIEVKSGEIEFDRVTFGYHPDRPVLKNVSAKIPSRKITAIVGPTGAGKSTLVNLVAKFYDPKDGDVRIDGQSTREANPSEIRKKVGYVFQDTFLFSGSVRDNIRYGRTDVSDEMMRNAANAAHVDEFVHSLPQGYDTRIGDGGVSLSGGQRQRVALARALVYDPNILILDDATSALDTRTESAVRDNVRQLFNDRTVLIVAHKTATIQSADHVVSLNEGVVT